MSDIVHELLKEFLAAHIVKGDSELLYSGELDMLSATVDSTLANKWYDKLEDNVEFLEYKLSLYGDMFNITIPVFSVEEEKKDITKEYRLLVSDYLKDGLFSDRRGMMLFKLLDSFDVCLYDGIISFEKKGDIENNLIKKTTSQSFKIADISTELDIKKLNDIDRYENIILLFKEVVDGYYDVRRHSMVDKQQGKYVQQEYVLGRDIYAEINTETREVIKVVQEETKYNARKDKDAWYIIDPEGVEHNAIGFKPYKTEVDGDVTKIRLYGAYTHILRDLLDFKPITWQYKLLLNQRRINFIAGCRRSGKTFLESYLVCRALWRMPHNKRHIGRTMKSLYVAPSEDKQKEVLDYIKTSAEKFRVLKVIDFNKKENRLFLYDEVIGRNQKITKVVSTCDMVSGKGFEPGRGKASDEILIDEGSIVHEDVRLNLLPIVENENARVTAVGTIDWKTRRQRFYKWLVESEKGIDEEQYGLRVTIDDIDVEVVDNASKERMKRALKDNKERYYAELYATFPENNSVFNSEGFFQITKERQPFEKVGGYIIGYDPAKRTDIGAVEVGEYRMGNNGNYVQIIEEHSLQGEYQNQKEVLRQIKNQYAMNGLGVPVYVIIDATQVGDVVAEMFGDIIDYRVWWTSVGTRPTIDKYGAWKCPKTHLVHLAQILIEKGLLKGWIGLKDLVDELKNFKSLETPSGNVKYEAEVGHDDHVAAMLLIGFYMGYIEGRAYEFAVDGQMLRPEGIGEDGLYEDMAYKMEKFENAVGNSYSF